MVLQLLDHKVAEQFFFMARTLFELPDSGFLPNPSLQTRCIEKTVIVAAKMASRSINCGLTVSFGFSCQGVEEPV